MNGSAPTATLGCELTNGFSAIATLGCKLATATRSVKKIVYYLFVLSARKEANECRGKGGLSTWIYSSLLIDNYS